MAENIRHDDPVNCELDIARTQLISECQYQAESCLYTSTEFYIWLRPLKCVRALLWIFGAVGSVVSASTILGGIQDYKIIMAGLALTGVLMPALIKATHLDKTIKDYMDSAATFKNLEGEFRRAANISSHMPFEIFKSTAQKSIDTLNEVRKLSLTPPEWCYRQAQKKIKKGDYDKDKNTSDH